MTEIVGTCPHVVLIVIPGIGQFDLTTGTGLRAFIASDSGFTVPAAAFPRS